MLGAYGTTDPDRGGIAIVAVALDHYYSSIEASLEMIGRIFDSASPAGSDWHRSLLRKMELASATRPPVLAPETAAGLEDLLAFRHFLRHAYAAELEWKRMGGLAAALPGIRQQVKKDISNFRDHVVRCLAEATRSRV